MDKFTAVKTMFENNQNKVDAASMSAYMKNQFVFYGIPSPQRKELCKDLIKSEEKYKIIDWEFLNRCYEDEHRELQYIVFDYLISLKKYIVFDDIEKIKYYIIKKSWWDTTDFLCKVIGDVGLRDERVSELMLQWSESDNIWLKRTALLHQLAYKNNTDTELLKKIIYNCFGTNEFFINKAIGWALRKYSKTNLHWVCEFIESNKQSLHTLTIKEASKYI